MKKTKFDRNVQILTYKPNTCLNSGEWRGCLYINHLLYPRFLTLFIEWFRYLVLITWLVCWLIDSLIDFKSYFSLPSLCTLTLKKSELNQVSLNCGFSCKSWRYRTSHSHTTRLTHASVQFLALIIFLRVITAPMFFPFISIIFRTLGWRILATSASSGK